jgi:hypothetical protein
MILVFQIKSDPISGSGCGVCPRNNYLFALLEFRGKDPEGGKVDAFDGSGGGIHG